MNLSVTLHLYIAIVLIFVVLVSCFIAIIIKSQDTPIFTNNSPNLSGSSPDFNSPIESTELLEGENDVELLVGQTLDTPIAGTNRIQLRKWYYMTMADGTTRYIRHGNIFLNRQQTNVSPPIVDASTGQCNVSAFVSGIDNTPSAFSYQNVAFQFLDASDEKRTGYLLTGDLVYIVTTQVIDGFSDDTPPLPQAYSGLSTTYQKISMSSGPNYTTNGSWAGIASSNFEPTPAIRGGFFIPPGFSNSGDIYNKTGDDALSSKYDVVGYPDECGSQGAGAIPPPVIFEIVNGVEVDAAPGQFLSTTDQISFRGTTFPFDNANRRHLTMTGCAALNTGTFPLVGSSWCTYEFRLRPTNDTGDYGKQVPQGQALQINDFSGSDPVSLNTLGIRKRFFLVKAEDYSPL